MSNLELVAAINEQLLGPQPDWQQVQQLLLQLRNRLGAFRPRPTMTTDQKRELAMAFLETCTQEIRERRNDAQPMDTTLEALAVHVGSPERAAEMQRQWREDEDELEEALVWATECLRT